MYEPKSQLNAPSLTFLSGYNVAATPTVDAQILTLRTHPQKGTEGLSVVFTPPDEIVLATRIILHRERLTLTIECLLNNLSLGQKILFDTPQFKAWHHQQNASITHVDFLYRGFGRYYQGGLWHPFKEDILGQGRLTVETGESCLCKKFPLPSQDSYCLHFAHQEDAPRTYLISPPGNINHYPYYPIGGVGSLVQGLASLQPAFFTVSYLGKETAPLLQTSTDLEHFGCTPPQQKEIPPNTVMVFPEAADPNAYMNVMEYIVKGKGRLKLTSPQGHPYIYQTCTAELMPGVTEYATLTFLRSDRLEKKKPTTGISVSSV